MGRADDDSPRVSLDAAGELCGVDLILEGKRAAGCRNTGRPRSETMEQDGLAPLPLHGRTRTEPRRLGADLQTIGPGPEKLAGR